VKMTSTQDAKDQARQAASTAADEGRHVAGVAGEEARNVAGEARQQARGLMDGALSQVDEQSRVQRDRLVETLRTFGDDLEQMASQGSGLAGDVTRQVAERARGLVDSLDGREPSEILDEVRDFARRRPGMFLAGALVAGVVAGRVGRGAKAAQSGTGTGGTGSDTSHDQGTYGYTAPVPPPPVPPAESFGTGTSSAPSYGQPEVAAPYTSGSTFADDGGTGVQASPGLGDDAPGRYTP